MQFLCRFYLRNKNISGFYLGFNRIAQSEHGAICLQSGPTIDRDESFNGIPLIIPQLISPLQRRPIKQNILVASGWNVWLGNISTFSLVQEGILEFIDEMISLYEFGHNDALKSSASPVTTIKFIGFDWWQLIELIEDLTPRWQSSLLTGFGQISEFISVLRAWELIICSIWELLSYQISFTEGFYWQMFAR